MAQLATLDAGAREAVRTLHPGYFALVMGTGIVSIAMHDGRLYALSVVLLWLTCISYLVLIAVSAVRIIAFARNSLTTWPIHDGGSGCSPSSQRPMCSAPDWPSTLITGPRSRCSPSRCSPG